MRVQRMIGPGLVSHWAAIPGSPLWYCTHGYSVKSLTSMGNQ